MDEAAAVREGAREVLRDVSPVALRRVACDAVANGWTAPGVVTVRAARRAGADAIDHDLRRRAVGVQLIYEGLALTRRLVREEPWVDGRVESDGGVAAPRRDSDEDPDVEVLAADVLVARGSNLLAYTEAADRCVEVIRNFGQRQTGRDGFPTDRELEADVMTLAAEAGTTAVTSAPAPHAVEWAESMASALDGSELPDADSLVAGAESVPGPNQAALANEGRGSSTDP
ncbi:hypothetical protein BRC81_08685 [Halobacteriales archaeon QS_1_68_20]|nr:MAG: hypothetical protein BRC81_08685 [Halobacteriales archaeon QS_1_68_20]